MHGTLRSPWPCHPFPHQGLPTVFPGRPFSGDFHGGQATAKGFNPQITQIDADELADDWREKAVKLFADGS